MKAVRIHSYGNTDVLIYEVAPIPEFWEDDVLIKVVAASVNPVDFKIRDGHLKEMITRQMPLILGCDVAGIVSSVGARITQFKVGDAVYALLDLKRNGSYAEYVAVNESNVAHKPKTISFVEAASIPLAASTAWQALFNTAHLKKGQRILIHGSSGGVGSMAVQLAKHCGAFVIATTSGVHVSLVKSLGADEVIDYQLNAFNEVVKNVDVVFDTIGGQVQDDSWVTLKTDGILVSIVSIPSVEQTTKLGVRSAFMFTERSAEILEELTNLIDEGEIRPLVGAEFSLQDTAKAHVLSEAGHTAGKIVLYVGNP